MREFGVVLDVLNDLDGGCEVKGVRVEGQSLSVELSEVNGGSYQLGECGSPMRNVRTIRFDLPLEVVVNVRSPAAELPASRRGHLLR